ncbi:MAG: HAMP domain-containing histidine kinase [Paramuribaculum sp.]|nr:HAMP domain-containing histidine kinase [Paramuribaculum sp.]
MNHPVDSMHKLIIMCLMCLLGVSASGRSLVPEPPSGDMRKALSDSVQHRLAGATTAADSLRMMYDIFDLSPRSQQFDKGLEIYNMATRMNSNVARLGILRQMANVTDDNDSLLNIVLRETLRVPPSDEQRATELFVRMFITKANAAVASEDERQRHLTEIIKKHAELDNDKEINDDDLYERLDRINTICTYLAQMSQGELLTSYLDEFGRLIRRLPKRLDAIENMYYIQMATTYAYIGEKQKSIEADKRLVRNFQRMRNSFVREGRSFRNYNVNLYHSYRRILSNYEALSPEEVETYYAECVRLAKLDPDVAAEFNSKQRAQIYYLMATKRYNEAIDLMLEERNRAYRTKHPVHLLRMLMVAAKATDNKKVLLDATLEYVSSLEEYVESRSHERYRELQVMYDVNQLKSANAELVASQTQAMSAYHRNILIVAVVSIVLLLILIAFLVVMYRRAMLLSRHLSETNDRLTSESENLRRTQRDLIAARDRANSADNLKTEFINNMSHEVEAPLSAIVEYSQLIVDTVAEDKKEYLMKFASIVTLSADLLQTIINDVLTINSIDSGLLSIKRMPVSAKELCTMAVETEKKHAQPGVKVVFENADSDDTATITTDSLRVEQVLINLVSNGVKFTSEGIVSLRYDFNHDRSLITFTVTDTGPGIGENEAEKIFERFYKGDKYSQGVGLGLPICRLVAKLLGGEVNVDKSYRGGARFTFTIPTA